MPVRNTVSLVTCALVSWHAAALAQGKSAVTPSLVTFPTGAEGSAGGLEGSFSPSPATGAGTYSVGLALAPGRAGFAPELALSYSTRAGDGDVGMGWSISGVAVIARDTTRAPRYVDAPLWTPREDTWLYDGTRLVPVGSEMAATIDCYGIGRDGSHCAAVPGGVTGWQQYRPADGTPVRVFRSPDARRWLVQHVDGSQLELGELVAGPAEMIPQSANAVQVTPSGDVFSVRVSRMSDRYGSAAYFAYDAVTGYPHLSTVHYVSPSVCAGANTAAGAQAARTCAAALSDYGARVQLVYEPRPDQHRSWRGGAEMVLTRRLARIDVTAAREAPGRVLVRRYRLGYHPGHRSYLASVTLEGRPEMTDIGYGVKVGVDVAEAALGDDQVGPLFPPITFAYTDAPAATDPAALMGGVDLTPRTLDVPPPPTVSVAQPDTDLFDVNGDGLVDVIRASGGDVEAWFNGFDGPTGTPAGVARRFSGAITMPVIGAPVALSLGDDRWHPGDTDADARSELVYVPDAGETQGRARPQRTVSGANLDLAAQGLEWQFGATAMSTPPSLDLAVSPEAYRYVDVDADGLVDILHITASETNVWWNLGRYEGGEGRFGRAVPGAIEAWTLEELPEQRCTPQFLTAVLLSDPNTRIADFNGDGLVDLALLSDPGLAVFYGRGNGDFGDPDSCGAANYDIYHPAALEGVGGSAIGIAQTTLADVNGDGFADIVRAGTDLRIRLGQHGDGFDPVVSSGALGPGDDAAVRLADIDGNLAVDVVRGEGSWAFVTPGGDQPAGLLRQIDNGLGKVTTISYGSAIDEYLADLQQGTFRWDESPMSCATPAGCPNGLASAALNTLVVKSIETTDRFGELRVDDAGQPDDQVSRIELSYHDGAFGGEDRSFWGFAVTDVCHVGDASQPTSCTRTHYHQARRPDALEGFPNLPNPYRALQGKEYLVETWSGDRYGETTHTSYSLRTWWGLDGQPIQQALPTQIDRLIYPDVGYADGGESYTLPGVVPEGPLAARFGTGYDAPAEPFYGDAVDHVIPVRAATFAHVRERILQRTNHGQVIERSRDGRLRDEHDVAPASYGEDIRERTPRFMINGAGQHVVVEASTQISGGGVSTARMVHYQHDEVGFIVTESQFAGYRGPAYDFGALGTTPGSMTLVQGYDRDAWGSTVATCVGGAPGGGDCLRSSQVTYEPEYGRFPTAQTVDTGAGTLQTTIAHDEVYGTVRRIVEPSGHDRRAKYDGFGRLSGTWSLLPGCTSPNATFHYKVAPKGAPVTVVITRRFHGCAPAAHAESRVYVDGDSRARATVSFDIEAGHWARTGVGLLNARGESRRTYQAASLVADVPTVVDAVALPATASAAVERDGFGRVTRTIDELGQVTEHRYGALSTERWEPDDLAAGGPNEGTPAITRLDGHGRVREQVLHRRVPGVPGDTFVRLITTHAPTGETLRLTRLASSDASPLPAGASQPSSTLSGQRVDRLFRYDTAGRLLAVEDPSLDEPSKPASHRSWRYLHNRAGDLVAVRDPRGCGQDFYYDHAGRKIGEMLVDCAESVPAALPAAELPANSIGSGAPVPALVHTRWWYDEAPPWGTAAGGFDPPAEPASGLVVAVESPTQRELYEHDDRGRLVRRQVQLAGTSLGAPLGDVPTLDAIPPPAPLGDTVYDIARTFSTSLHYDFADRLVRRDLPSDPDWAAMGGRGLAPVIQSHATHDPRRGLPERLWVTIDGVEHDVVGDASYDVNGHLTAFHVGAPGGGLSLSYGYDALQRPTSIVATRTPTALPDPATRPLGAVTTVTSLQYQFDAAGRLVALRDLRDPMEWPDGYQPREQAIQHDSLGRVVGIEMRYAETDAGDFAFGGEEAVDWRTGFADQSAVDPMHPVPAPAISGTPIERVANLTYDYDWLATRVEWTDDQHAFFDRSTGTAVTGLEVGRRPSAVYLWSNLDPATPADLGGYAVFEYGQSGNVVGMTVRAQCTDGPAGACVDPGGTDLDARVSALSGGCQCASEQHYRYDYGARNELMLARRYDRNGVGSWTIATRQRDLHDETKTRRVQVVETYSGGGVDTHAMQVVLPGIAERRGTAWDVAEGWQGSAALGTELHYTTAGARLVWKPGAPVAGNPDPSHRLTYRVTDALETTSAVVDLVSNEIASVSTYHPTGARETHRVHDDALPVEPRGFTGKEEDVGVGLIYFGQRYLIAGANQWSSADPAEIHDAAGGEALNPYHYVGGGVFSARDPDGLAPVGTYHGIDRLLAKQDLADPTPTEEDKARGFRLRTVHESSGLSVRDIVRMARHGELPAMNIRYVHERGPDTLISVHPRGFIHAASVGRLYELRAVDRTWGRDYVGHLTDAEWNAHMLDRVTVHGHTVGQAQAEYLSDWRFIVDLAAEGAGIWMGQANSRAKRPSPPVDDVLNKTSSLFKSGRKSGRRGLLERINAGNRTRVQAARQIDAIPEGAQRRAFRREMERLANPPSPP